MVDIRTDDMFRKKGPHVWCAAWCSGGQIYAASVLSSAAAGTEDTRRSRTTYTATCNHPSQSRCLLSDEGVGS